MVEEPYGYFLTFTCYGVRLHGDPRGSVARQHNLVGARYLEEDLTRNAAEQKLMTAEASSLTADERPIILEESFRAALAKAGSSTPRTYARPMFTLC